MRRLLALSLAGFALMMPIADDAAAAGRRATDTSDRSLSVLAEMLDEIRSRYIEPISDAELVRIALEALGQRDKYSKYLSPDEFRQMREEQRGSYAGIGARFQRQSDGLRLVQVLEESPAESAGLALGDVIVAIDGRSALDGPAAARIRGPEGQAVALMVKRPGQDKMLAFSVVRGEIVRPAVKVEAFGDVGYVRLRTFNKQADTGVRHAVEALRAEIGPAMRGLILDLRGNRGGLVTESVAIADAFLDHGAIMTQSARNPRDERSYEAHPGDITGGLPLVVLVDGKSASASEILTGALQDQARATVVGTTTYGKGVVQTIIRLNDGGALKLTTAHYYTPSGRMVDGAGIEPDLHVDPAVDGTPAWPEKPDPSADPQLAKAIEVLTGSGARDLQASAQRAQALPAGSAATAAVTQP